jgi:hypothetical protein
VPDAPPTEQKPLRACQECGAPLQDEHQEMCVECGAAVASEPRPRIRRVLSPVALGVFATLMVASAAYGLSSNLGADTQPAAGKLALAPPVATPAPAPAPAPPAPPATTPQPSTPSPAPPSTPAPAAKPAPPAPAAKPAHPAPASRPASPQPSRAPSPSRPSHTTRPPHTPDHAPTGAQPARAWAAEGDQPYSAKLYDPYGDGTDEHAAAAPKAVDGRPRTAWTTADHPGGLGKPGVGLVLEAGGFQSYSAIGVQTATPGFRVEIYSTAASDPPAGGPSAAGWRHEATKSGVKNDQRIALRGATAEPSYILVWITTLPAGKSRAGLSEISFLP